MAGCLAERGQCLHSARDLLSGAWEAAVLACDDAATGWIAFTHGVLALYEGEERMAAAHFHEAAHLIPAHTPGGPTRAVCLAALAVAQSAHAPTVARRTLRRALAQPATHGDTWSGLVIRYAEAFVEHRMGNSGRALHHARRALAVLDATVPEPLVGDALRQLTAAIEAGEPGRLYMPRMSWPPTVIPWVLAIESTMET